jgi:hypothetical protein
MALKFAVEIKKDQENSQMSQLKSSIAREKL